MSYEYKIEHYGALEPDLKKIETLAGSEIFNTLEFMVSIESESTIIASISGTDKSRVAFSKLIQYMLSVSDSIVVHDL